MVVIKKVENKCLTLFLPEENVDTMDMPASQSSALADTCIWILVPIMMALMKTKDA